MSEFPINVQINDVLSVFAFDGFTKVPGVNFADFDVIIWKDSVDQTGHSYSVSEIDAPTGDYRFAFTPNTTGLWRAEARVAAYRNTWLGEYLVVEATSDEVYALVRRALGLIHENIFIDDTVYDANGQLTSGRVRLFDSNTDTDAATDGGGPPPGGSDPQHFAAYAISVVWEGINQYKVFKQTLEP
jgi:hypothetical protein